MNNEPVAWFKKLRLWCECAKEDKDAIPLYTHPAKTQSHTETAVKILNYLGYAQEPSKEEGADVRRDKLVEIISQSHSAKTLTDEEILKLYVNNSTYDNDQKLFIDIYGFARAILRKAQEK